MPFPASSAELASAYVKIKNRALFVRSQSQGLRTAANGTVSASTIIDYVTNLARVRAELTALAATPGLGPYAQAQENNPGLNIAAEYQAMIDQVIATTTWIAANFPQDGTGYKLAFTLAANGDMVWRSFDAASLAGLRTVLDALIATIA